MVGIKCLRLTLVRLRAAQTDRIDVGRVRALWNDVGMDFEVQLTCFGADAQRRLC
jgi:hypothetical protein